MKEHDVVISKEYITDVPVGTIGTIVHVWNDENFEVEFRINNNHYVKGPLTKNQIKLSK